MTKPGLRARRVAELIQEELGRLMIREFQDPSSGLVTVTRVEVTPDLLNAHVSLSVFGAADPQGFLDRLEKSKGYIRKTLASRVKLKYNPGLFFALDEGPEYADKIDRLIERTKKHDT
ncbi:MAG: 30S ribosome-binding factor RbfA [Candidatus Aminicenantales bacterium]|jgi:ribosome-binding factor A